MFLMFPLSSQIVKTSGVLTETNWAGAAFNLILYMLVSHIVGASWYLLSIERQEACWREACRLEMPQCQYRYLDCNSIDDSRNLWFRSSNLTELCKPRSGFYKFGIYADAVDSNLTSAPFFHKYLYCFWWGLKNLSSLGQNFETSMFAGENVFAIVVAILGLVLFGLLIGNMQSYLQSTVVRLEEWRNKRTDTEQWMKHRQLPLELKQCVRRYDQYNGWRRRGSTRRPSSGDCRSTSAETSSATCVSISSDGCLCSTKWTGECWTRYARGSGLCSTPRIRA
ncbi:putative cyclic nucleotide-gated ion channel 15 [Iris pallida]|uniref:Cyclic nucleotide-gated ion channel 15 n=1 Tax=Iris pallida TaxID=29817 RepID=A0AAX6DXE4_IRIPA|nr:putative cyclic nucleotide-gated ion channel 15 [Iris pallida]